MIGDGVKDFHYFNAAFEQPDVETAQFLHEAMIEREPGQNQIRTYDFDDPVTGYVQGIGRLPYVPADSWMTEAWYHQAANNNVACTATVTATNLAILFRRMGYSNAASNSPISTFNNIAEEMGVQSAWNANGLDNYFSEHNYEVDYELSTSVNSSQYQLYNEIKDGVLLGNPSVIAASKTSGFSWVLGLGWLETTDGHFVEVVSSTAASDGLYFRVESRVMNSVFVYEAGSYNADTGAFLERLYLKCLNRIPPDEEGFLNWLGVLYNPNYGGGTVARGFFLSQEYENRGRTRIFLKTCTTLCLTGNQTTVGTMLG